MKVLGDDIVEEWWKGIPRCNVRGRACRLRKEVDSPGPESQQETKPGEEEDSSIFVDRVQDRD